MAEKITKRKRYTTKEKQQLVNEYQKSGEPQQAWCEKSAVAVPTLRKWLRNISEHKETTFMEWTPVTVSKLEDPREAFFVEIGKCRVVLPDDYASRENNLRLFESVIEILVRKC